MLKPTLLWSSFAFLDMWITSCWENILARWVSSLQFPHKAWPETVNIGQFVQSIPCSKKHSLNVPAQKEWNWLFTIFKIDVVMQYTERYLRLWKVKIIQMRITELRWGFFNWASACRKLVNEYYVNEYLMQIRNSSHHPNWRTVVI